MNKEIEKVLKYDWEPWLKRPFFAFILSTFEGGTSKVAFSKIGFKDWEFEYIFSNGEWFWSDQVFRKIQPKAIVWLKHHSVVEVNDSLESLAKKWRKEVAKLSLEPEKDTFKKMERLSEIFHVIISYIWVTHILDHTLDQMLRLETKKYIHTDIEKFIGDASYPKRLNAAALLVEDFKNGIDAKTLTKKYGWMRARDGFSEPYNEKEIIGIAKNGLLQPKHVYPEIPKNLVGLFDQARELVYLRMLRMDIYFELMLIARPILQAVGKKLDIPYSKLKFYTIQSLIAQKPISYPEDFACLGANGKNYYFDKPLFKNKKNSKLKELKGTIAQVGFATGQVKVVLNVAEMKKVQKGDILVTYMTSPNFLPAMKLAAAFVTNEGGLTCHAAIVAREMKKPCIIGTKIATKIFKDGDLVEVDANKGIVKKIQKHS